MACEPAASAVVVSVAMPAAEAEVPRSVEPSLKVTLPEAVGSLTVAVRVTESPAATVAADVVRLVVVAVFVTGVAKVQLPVPASMVIEVKNAVVTVRPLLLV
jgi:hypothetical protein